MYSLPFSLVFRIRPNIIRHKPHLSPVPSETFPHSHHHHRLPLSRSFSKKKSDGKDEHKNKSIWEFVESTKEEALYKYNETQDKTWDQLGSAQVSLITEIT